MLALVAEGRLDPDRSGGDEVYRLTRRAAAWASLVGPGQTIGVDARVHGCTDVPSALLARARVRDAVCDSVRDTTCAHAGLPNSQALPAGCRTSGAVAIPTIVIQCHVRA